MVLRHKSLDTFLLRVNRHIERNISEYLIPYKNMLINLRA